MLRYILFLFVLMFSVSPAFGSGTVEVPRITPEELNSKLERGDGVLVLDVRAGLSKRERLTVIKGAVRKPLAEIYRGAGLPADMEKEIVTYCT